MSHSSKKQLNNKDNSSAYSSQDEKNHHHNNHHSLSQPMRPTILMKPQSKAAPTATSATNSQGDNSSTAATAGNWSEVSNSPTAPVAPKLSFSIGGERKGSLAKGATTDSKYKTQSNQSGRTTSTSSNFSSSEQSASKPFSKYATKIIDSGFHWIDSGIDMLQDQNDFLVVGVLGLQGVGKSTVMSLLANNKFEDHKNAVFRKQTPEVKERAAHMTTGIDFAVTSERLILLDTQPILSASVLEQLIHDRKNADFSGNPSIQMQSLQLATFILTVCHVVIVVQDYFTDANVFNFLKKAEMVKPPIPAPTHENSSPSSGRSSDRQPVIIFVHNKMESDMFTVRSICKMNAIVNGLTQYTGMHCKGHFSLLQSNLYPGLSEFISRDFEANNFLFPNTNDIENDLEKTEQKKVNYEPSDQYFLELPAFTNRPSLDHLSNTFVKMVLSVPRYAINHQVLTEKTWFHYAARTWEAIKKSQALTEFSRLISS